MVRSSMRRLYGDCAGCLRTGGALRCSKRWLGKYGRRQLFAGGQRVVARKEAQVIAGTQEEILAVHSRRGHKESKPDIWAKEMRPLPKTCPTPSFSRTSSQNRTRRRIVKALRAISDENCSYALPAFSHSQ